jgi:hypothetical protein
VTIRYLYIDDEDEAGTRPLVDALTRTNDELVIALRRPEEFSKDLRAAVDEKPDGLILDLRLDLVPGSTGYVADYRAPSLAQEIRTRATGRELLDLPIVLWSTQVKLNQSFNRDGTGQDLFDLTYAKEDVGQRPAEVARDLIAVAEGYRTITGILAETSGESARMRRALGIGPEAILDARISERFAGKDAPVHEYARFLMQEVICQPGALLDELRLAALLGVDRARSDDWSGLMTLVENSRYSGVFSQSHFRWWRWSIDRWWSSLNGGKRSLRLLNARERVEVLRAASALQSLTAAEPILPTYSDRFSTICEGTHRPLDPADGFRLRGKEPEPWQEPRYISAYAALERIGYEGGLRVHPLERDRYDALFAEVTSSVAS